MCANLLSINPTEFACVLYELAQMCAFAAGKRARFCDDLPHNHLHCLMAIYYAFSPEATMGDIEFMMAKRRQPGTVGSHVSRSTSKYRYTRDKRPCDQTWQSAHTRLSTLCECGWFGKIRQEFGKVYMLYIKWATCHK